MRKPDFAKSSDTTSFLYLFARFHLVMHLKLCFAKLLDDSRLNSLQSEIVVFILALSLLSQVSLKFLLILQFTDRVYDPRLSGFHKTVYARDTFDFLRDSS